MTGVGSLVLAVLATRSPTAGALSVADIAHRSLPCVVAITSSGPGGDAIASGFVVNSSGTIITNLHVIRGARKVTVKTPKGDVFDQVRVRTFDARRDIAIIQIDGFGLPSLPLGNSDSVRVGDPVVLIGNPLGLEGSVSSGVVSSVRALEAGTRVIQTDASANPGNSGGPLLNRRGDVIGILSFKLRGAENLNFVVPINYARGPLEKDRGLSLVELDQELGSEETGPHPEAAKWQFPELWKRQDSDSLLTVTVSGEVASVTGAAIPGTAAVTVELRKAGNRYVGAARGTQTLCRILGARAKVCIESRAIEITSISPSRIEGFVEDGAPGDEFNCDDCTHSKPLAREPFVWVPAR